MKDRRRTSRRAFMKGALGAAAMWATSPNFGCAAGDRRQVEASAAPAEPPPPSGKYKDLRIAYLGTGGIGGHHFEETVPLGVSCPCYCDVDTARFEKAAKHFPKARAYQDYRELFDKEHKNIDAVMIGIPDHHHYTATMIAMQLGKHVYTQKPLTHTVWEARKLLEAAERYKVVTQMGNQGHAKEGWRLVYEFIHSGALGAIREVHTWTDRPIWPQGMLRPEQTDEVPSNLNWDVWLGPAPERPYKKDIYHPFNWRGWLDFGTGALGDMACHMMDGIFWALDPGHPTSIEPLALTEVTAEAYPRASIIKWEFPTRGRRRPFAAYWYDGGLRPPVPEELEPGRRMPTTGNLFIGSKAKMLVSGDYGDSPRIIPESKMREIGKPPQLLERSPGHVLEWIMACVGEKPADYPKTNFSYSSPMTEVILLGNIALRMGRRLEWDGPAMTFKNCPEANQYLTREYREGWRV